MSKKRFGPKQIPAICKKCGYRAAGDPETAAQAQALIQGAKDTAGVMWEVIGRALDDAYGGCPGAAFGKPLTDDWCDGCEGREDIGALKLGTGDPIHMHWHCWTKWLAEAMISGAYNLSDIRRRIEEMNQS